MFKTYNHWRIRYEDAPPATADPAAPDDGGADIGTTKETFTQDDVNRFLAIEKRKFQEKQSDLMNQLTALQTQKEMTEDTKSRLTTVIDSLKNDLKTKEQVAKEETERLKTTLSAKAQAAEEAAEAWRQKYETSTIQRELVSAAASNNAVNPSQILAILGPQTQLVEILDEEKNPTGEFEVKVSLSDPIEKTTLTLSPAEAVKRLSESDDYYNLFKIDNPSGFGGTNRSGSVKTGSMEALAKTGDFEAYRKARKQASK